MPETTVNSIGTPRRQGLMAYDFGKPVKFYSEQIARNPLLMSLIQGAGGYMLAKHLGAPLLEWALPAKTRELKKRRKRMLPWMGALAGMIPPALITHGRMQLGRDPTLGKALTRGFYEPPEKQSNWPYVPTQPGVQNLILTDPVLSPYEKAVAIQAVNKAQTQSDKPRGLVTTGDLMRGAIGAGLGYLGAKLFGKVLGLGFSLPPQAQKRINQVGVIGGILGNTGVLRVAL